MTIKTTLTMVKLSSVVFLSATLIFAMKYYDSQLKNKQLEETLKLDKKTYVNDLKEIFNRYDAEVVKNKKLLDNISITPIKDEKINHKNVVKIIQKESTDNNLVVTEKYDSLKSVLKNQNEENKSLATQVSILVEKNKELSKKNSDNERVIAVSKNLTATNVYANGIKIVSNNIIETKRFSATEQIKVCFTLLENKAAIKGNKDIFIQILNPSNKVVNKKGEFVESKDRLLHYSAMTNVFYDNDEMDVCVFVDPNKNDIQKGDYEINIFSGINLIGSTVFSLK